MEIKILDGEFSVAQFEKMPEKIEEINFCAVTEEEISVLCRTDLMPENPTKCEDGFSGLMISGTLDFSLIGIISRISTILADNAIAVFVVSTFNTDYIFVKKEELALSCQLLSASGYDIL